MNAKPKIGLALGSGGARGWCHIGVIRSLEAMGIVPDVVAGSSIGAFVGAVWSAGKLAELEDWVRGLTRRHFLGLMDLHLGAGGLVEAREVETLLRELGVPDAIEDLARPFTAIATEMETGRELWFTHGLLYPAVRASAAIPGVITPLRHNGRWLIDGGVVNPVPVSAVRAQGAEVIIAVDPNAKPTGRLWYDPPLRPGVRGVAGLLPEPLRERLGIKADPRPGTPNYFEVISVAIEIMEDTILRSRLAGEPPHVLLNAHLGHLNVLELYHGAEAIDEGERMVRDHADRLREVCGLEADGQPAMPGQ